MNILSFDIEDWFHPEIFNGKFPRSQWDQLESRVVSATELIYSFLSKKNLKATFFFLGWVAEKFPELVKIADREGHEIATHGYSHRMITQMSPDEFREDLRRSLEILRSLTNQPVQGFRAPTFSVTHKTLWALPIMLEEGIRYDSSIFPIVHDRYGIPDAPRDPFVVYADGAEQLIEYPMTTVKFGRFNLPCSGGGYFRLFPFALTKKLMQRCQAENRSIIFYAHPWEFDTGLPKVDLGLVGKFRHYYGISHFLERLDEITDLFPFSSFKDAKLMVDYNLSLGANSAAFAF
jgi:polysaccharide deacetylase family protein (PEP-CTERM system associated)